MRFIIDVIFTVIQTRIINTRIPGNTLVDYITVDEICIQIWIITVPDTKLKSS